MTAPSDIDLLQAYLAGELPAREITILEERLKIEQALASTLIVLSQEEAILREWAQAQAASVSIEQTAPSLKVRPVSFSRGKLLGRLFLAAAVLLTIFGSYLAYHRVRSHISPDVAQSENDSLSKDDTQPIGNLEEVYGEVFVQTGDVTRPVQVGQSLFLGQKLSTRGEDSYAVLSFNDSSRLEIGEHTTISLPAKRARNKRITLEQGSLAVKAPRKAANRPMTFATPHARFVSADSNVSILALPDETLIEPEEGLVDMATANGTNQQIKVGEVAVVTKTGLSLERSGRKAKMAHRRNKKK